MLKRLFKRNKPRHRRTWRDRGASAVEYGLMVAAIAAIIVGVVFSLGSLVKEAFTRTCTSISSELPASGACLPSPAVPPSGP